MGRAPEEDDVFNIAPKANKEALMRWRVIIIQCPILIHEKNIDKSAVRLLCASYVANVVSVLK